MLSQFLNAIRQYGNLHLGRAGILVVDSGLRYELLFLGF